ncbi:MAG: hypothetical protein Q9174_007530, partial [Haloplaca sp. 1 TL-2023]
MWHDGVVSPHPPITRALKVLGERLKQVPGIEVIDFAPHLHDEAWAILSSLYCPDGGASDLATIAESGEPILPLTQHLIESNPCVKKLTLEQLGYWEEEREEYRIEYAKHWNKTGVLKGGDDGEGEFEEREDVMDVLICPAAPGVATRHNSAKYWGYTAQWNLLDYPAVVFPVTKVDKRVDVYGSERKKLKPLSDLDAENHKLYDAEMFDGMPVGVQMVARRFEDEKLLA